MALSDSIQTIKGIGPKKAGLFHKLAIETMQDALDCYPRDYEDRTHIVSTASVQEGQKAAICAVVGTQPVTRRIRKGMEITKFRVFDDSGALWITYYNNRYTAAALQEGQEYLFYGRIQGQGAQRTMVSPACEAILPGMTPPRRVIPIYPLTAGLTQKDLWRVTTAALSEREAGVQDWMPPEIAQRYDLLTQDQAVRCIHRPQSLKEVERARQRIIFEELFLLCCGLAHLKERRADESGICFHKGTPDAFWALLPFTPTNAQRRAAEEIWKDVRSGKPMNRLVQGDVGSGKTVLAAVLCYLAVQNGYQAAIMAPTEILAAQHLESLAPIFAQQGIVCALLSGSMTAKQKRECKEKIASGEIQVIIGTHALIQKDVQFHRLGAVIADEQHRFGVAQRATLHEKGEKPHTLVMSATPIPRTLALILYGDLDVSIVDELPPGRTPVETYAVGEKMRPRIYAFIDKQIAQGGQVYVVCPLVEDGELPLKSAEEHGASLQKILPHRRIGILHGKMKPTEKDQVMSAFAAGQLDILVATTVIEVGVNVPNACLMVIEDADRFGLSQLHQLRGRVGRGKRKSYCICFGADKGDAAKQRLKILCQTNDGFEIARADLAQRGPGDFFGKRQHGLPMLKMADMAADMALMQSAKEEAETLIARDPTFAQHNALRERVARMFREDNGEIFN